LLIVFIIGTYDLDLDVFTIFTSNFLLIRNIKFLPKVEIDFPAVAMNII